MKVRRGTAVVAAAAVLVAVLTANDDGRRTDAAAERAGSPETLADFFGWTASRDATEERIVQACMRSRGFPYEVDPASAPQAVGPGMSPDAYAEKYGYGIVEPGQSRGEVRIDPNFEHFTALPPFEQARYLEAFQGDASNGEAEEGSCSRQANALVNLDHEFLREAFASELAAIERAVTDELASGGHDEAWRRCMRRQGFDDAVSPEQFIPDASAAIRSELEAAGADPEARNRVLRREIAVATAERSCTRPLEERTNTRRHQLEDRFIRRNRSALDEIRARYGCEVAAFLS